MTQVARPQSDVSDSGWSPQPVFAQLNEVTADDTSFVTTAVNPQGASFVVALDALGWPDSGPQTLTVRLQKTGTDDVPVQLVLLQGSSLVAARTARPTQSFQNFSFQLTPAEVQRITNYRNLRVRVTAGYAVQVPCCTNTLPALLLVSLTDKTGNCNCLPDSLYATFESSFQKWLFSGTWCGGVNDFTLSCPTGPDCSNFQLHDVIGGATYQPSAGCSCSPLSLVYASVSFGGCSGTATVTITEPAAV